MKKFKTLIRMMMTLVLAAGVIPPCPASAAESAPAIRVQSLNEFVPEEASPATRASFSFLSGDRLLILSDRLTLIGLNPLELIGEAPFPESLNDPEMVLRSDRVQELETGFGWFVEKVRESFIETRIALYEYDDNLKLIRDVDLNEICDIPTTILFGLARNGVDLFYKSDSWNLYRRNLDTEDETMIFEMTRDLTPGTFSINSFNLIRNGETIFFEGSQYVPEDADHTTHAIYGMMSADGEEITIRDTEEFAEIDENASAVQPYRDHTPVTSPAALISPPEPIPDDPDDLQSLPAKTLYVWNAETDTVSKIPLQEFMEDRNMALSANGKYLATAVRENLNDLASAIVVRVYDAGTGAERLRQPFPDGDRYDVQTIAVSEETESVRLIYRQREEVVYAEIPFGK